MSNLMDSILGPGTSGGQRASQPNAGQPRQGQQGQQGQNGQGRQKKKKGTGQPSNRQQAQPQEPQVHQAQAPAAEYVAVAEVVPAAPGNRVVADFAPAPQAAPAPAPEEQGEEFNPAPVPLRALLEHHLSYYAFPPEDTALLDQALSMVRNDRRCRDKRNWIVLNPDGRDFLTVTNDKELSRAAGMAGTAIRLSLIEMLDQQPVPLGQILLFREEFREFLRPCSHLIALQVMSKNLAAAITQRPVSRDLLLDIKTGVAEIYERRHRDLTMEKLSSVSLAVIADAHPQGISAAEIIRNLEALVLKHASGDF